MPKKRSGNPRDEVMKAIGESAQSEEGTGSDDQDVDAADNALKNEDRPVQPTKKSTAARQLRTNTEQPPPDKSKSGSSAAPLGKKKNLWLLIGILGVLIVGVAVLGYFVVGKRVPPSNSSNSGTTSSGALVARRIDGVIDDPTDQNRWPAAVIVENHPEARPQSGLDKANVVYEALAEGGITRFLAIYTLTDPVKEIGPVRSARPYFVDLARAYNPLFVYVGGSPKALARIAATGIMDGNQFFNSQYFWRDTSRNVASEHTLYTSSQKLALALIDKKVPAEGTYAPWKFKRESAISERPASQQITINFSSFSYKVDYQYDSGKNDYVRSVAEKLHTVKDGTQLRPKNVIVMEVKRRLEAGSNLGRLEMDIIGQGTARFFLDGMEVKGTWKKDSAASMIIFTRDDGSELQLNPGQTWVEVVPPEQEVTVR